MTERTPAAWGRRVVLTIAAAVAAVVLMLLAACAREAGPAGDGRGAKAASRSSACFPAPRTTGSRRWPSAPGERST